MQSHRGGPGAQPNDPGRRQHMARSHRGTDWHVPKASQDCRNPWWHIVRGDGPTEDQVPLQFSAEYILWRSNKQTKVVLKWLWMLKNGNDGSHYRQLAEAGAWSPPRRGQIRWGILWGAVLLCTLLLSFKQSSVADFPWRTLLRVQKGLQASCGPLPQIRLFV